MPLIQRPIKQFGFREYLDDYNAAPLNPTPPPTHIYHIHPAEVDADLDTIYALINGQLDDSNIAGGANISGTKLANGTVTIAKLTSNGVDVAIPNNLGFSTVETPIATLPPLTTTGGRVRLEGGPVGLVISNGVTGTVTLKWYEDGSALPTSETQVPAANANASAISVPLPLPTFIRAGASASAHTYVLKAVTTDIGIIVVSAPAGACGRAFATEVP